MLRSRSAVLTGVLPLALGVALVSGCSKNATAPRKPIPRAPNTEITYAPVENDTVSYRVHLYWTGYDADGQVVAYYWIVDPDSSDLHDAAHTHWTRTTRTDTTLLFLVDPVGDVKGHEFVIAARDNSGLFDPTPAMRHFSAISLPPRSQIDKGPAATNPIIGPNFTFQFSGVDPDGGETGGSAPVDSFEYLLLRPGVSADTLDLPGTKLPAWDLATYLTLINKATGGALPPPYQDWRWQGIRGTKGRFQNQLLGEYVFALRAVDISGATERNLDWDRNIRHFTVTDRGSVGPALSVTANVLTTPLPSAAGPVDFARKPLELFEGETVSFSWSGDASAYGGEIVGYSFALDDTSALGGGSSLLNVGVTLGPDRLVAGTHTLYVRCLDDAGLVTNAVIPLLIVHPSFKDPGAPREILYVDDSLGLGDSPNRLGSFPSDLEEDTWFLSPTPSQPLGEARFPRITAAYPGVTVTEWDTWQKGLNDVEGRKQPQLEDLKDFSTVVWYADFNNTPSTPIALWKTLVGGSYSELAGYLRAGGTLVLSGYNLVGCSTDPARGANLLNNSRGLCYWQPGDIRYQISFFPRLFMDVNSAVPSLDGRRALGARDFVAAYPTAAGMTAGFDTCYVDTGNSSSGAKWDTYSELGSAVPPPSFSYMDQTLAPGLFRIEGWIMMPNYQDAATGSFGCQPIQEFARENLSVPIAQPIYTYHGVDVGIAQSSGPSPREGRVCGLLCQSHDLGLSGGGAYNPNASIGRCVILGFPFYFIKDQEASNLLFNAYTYVQDSPTLP